MKDNQTEFVEIDLKKYIMILIERWKLILFIILFSLLTAWTYAFFMVEDVYQVESQLIRSVPSYKNDFNAEIFNKREYKSIFSSNILAEQVIDELNLNKAKYNSDKLLGSLTVSIGDEENYQLINIKYETTQPKIGQKIINTWMKLFEDKSLKLLREEVLSTKQIITNEYQTYKNEANKIQEKYYEFQNNNQIQLLQNKISSREKKIVGYEERLLDIKNQIRQKSALVKELSTSLASEEKFHKLNLAISDSQLLEQLKILGAGKIEIERLNPLYTTFKEKIENSQAKLQELKAEKEVLGDNLKNLNTEIKSLRIKLSHQQRKLKELERELNIVEEKYEEVSKQKKEVDAALESQSNGVKISYKAVEPQNPIKPNRFLILSISAVVGLILGISAAFIADLLENSQEKFAVEN